MADALSDLRLRCSAVRRDIEGARIEILAEREIEAEEAKLPGLV